MEIRTNRLDTANVIVEAVILNKEIDKNEQIIAKELSKTADIAGFRKGKVPITAIKKQYGEKLRDDAQAKTIQNMLDDALVKMDINSEDIIGEPQITKLDKKDDTIEVEVKVFLRPEIELTKCDELVDEFEKPKISDEEVIKRVKQIAKSQAPLKEIEENRTLANGDFSNINFEGFLNGVAFDGGKADNFSLEIGSNQFIPGFETQLIGMKKGESKEINVTFPDGYTQANLSGKDVVFKVKLNSIEEKSEAVLDDELAKKLLPDTKDATVDKLKNQIKTQLEGEVLNKLYNDKLKSELLQKLVSTIIFDLPSFVVEQEIDMALNKKAQTMTEDELKELKDDIKKVEEMRETFREDAQNSVKATFIIDALAKEKSINVSEDEVMQTLYYEAMQTGQDPKELYAQYQKSGYLPAVQMAMIEDRVLSRLLNDKMKEA